MEEWPTVRFGDVVQKMNGKIDLEERAGKLCVRGEHSTDNILHLLCCELCVSISRS